MIDRKMTPITILNVEDNRQNRQLMQAFMESQPYSLLEAHDGMSALKILDTSAVDLILMDINLPDLDGLTLTRMIRESTEYADLPIIAVTADYMHGDRQKCIEAGCDAYVAKPIMRIELFNQIRIALQSQHDR